MGLSLPWASQITRTLLSPGAPGTGAERHPEVLDPATMETHGVNNAQAAAWPWPFSPRAWELAKMC